MENILGRLLKLIADLPSEVLVVLCDLAEKLSGKSWREWLAELKKFLRKEPCWIRQAIVWQTWKTIKIGTHQDIKSLKADLKKAGRQISDWADDILKKVTLSGAEEEIELVLLTVKDLGFKNGATLKEIFKRAFESGLGLCPAEVGLQLALQYLDQPLGEWIRVAMEPMADSEGHLYLFFVVRNGDGLWLFVCFGYPAFSGIPSAVLCSSAASKLPLGALGSFNF